MIKKYSKDFIIVALNTRAEFFHNRSEELMYNKQERIKELMSENHLEYDDAEYCVDSEIDRYSQLSVMYHDIAFDIEYDNVLEDLKT